MKLSSLLLILGTASLVAASETKRSLRRSLEAEEVLEGNAFQVSSEFKSTADGPNQHRLVSLTLTRDAKPQFFSWIPSEKSRQGARDEGKVTLFLSPFFMNHIPISEMLRPFRGEREIFERDFAEALSMVATELKRENIYVRSILSPAQNMGTRTLEKSKVIFHDLMDLVSLKGFFDDLDEEMGSMKTALNASKGFTRIEWFYVDREKLGDDVVKVALERANQIIGDIRSPFWRSTPFGRKILSIPDRLLSAVHQINDSLKTLRANVNRATNLRGGNLTENVRKNVDTLSQDIATINRNVGKDLSQLRSVVNQDLHAVGQNVGGSVHDLQNALAEKLETFNFAVNEDLHAINENVSAKVEQLSDTLNQDVNGLNRSIKEKIASANDAASKDLDGTGKIATRQYSALTSVLRNEIGNLDTTLNSRIDTFNNNVNNQVDQINTGIDQINVNLEQISSNLQNSGDNIIHFIFTPRMPFRKILIAENDLEKIHPINFERTPLDIEDDRRLFRPLIQLGQRGATMRILADGSAESDRVIARVTADSTSSGSGSPDSEAAPEETKTTTTNTPATGEVSGAISTTTSTPKVTFPCVEEGIDYYGYDIEKIEDGSIHSCTECQAICQKNSECYFWTFNVTDNWCYLKNKEALEGRREQPKEMKLVSGTKECVFEENALPKVPCNAEGVDLLGHDIEKIEGDDTGIASKGDCLQACKSRPQCFYYTFNTKDNSCYLKDKNALSGWTHSSDTLHLISGAKRCAA